MFQSMRGKYFVSSLRGTRVCHTAETWAKNGCFRSIRFSFALLRFEYIEHIYNFFIIFPQLRVRFQM